MNAAEAAIAAAACGWAVFPCRPGDKRPAIDRWEDRASADPAHVAVAWRDRYRHANVGIACGPSGLVVIDLDTESHGGQPAAGCSEPGIRDGRDVLADLAERAAQSWPATYSVATPSGGLHLYFEVLSPGREIRNSAGKIGPMIDVRGAGGYVVGAGSVIGSRTYEIADERPVEPLPRWLADLADPPRRERSAAVPAGPVSRYGRLRGIIEAVLASEPGTRNGRLYWAACRAAEMVAGGQLDRATAERVLLDAAIEAGLRGGEHEARRTIASGLGGTA